MKYLNNLCWLVVSLILALGSQTAFAQSDFWEQTNGPYATLVLSLAVDNSSGYIFAATQLGVYRSTDNGDTWTQTGLDDAVSHLAIYSSGRIFAATDEGVFRSTDNGDTWTLIGSSDIEEFSSLTIDSSGHIFAGTGDGVYRSEDNGDTWTLIGLAGYEIDEIAINSSDHIFAGAEHHGILRSTDNGDTWTKINNGLPDIRVHSLAINTSGHIFAGTQGEGVFRSTNNGDSWTQTGLTDVIAWCLAINSSGHIFAGTTDGVYRSIDSGDTWTQIGLDKVKALSINYGDTIFAGTINSGVFYSNDNGNTWIQINNGLPLYPFVWSLVINSNNTIFAGTNWDIFPACYDLFCSTDDGDTWMLLDIPGVYIVYILAVNSISGDIFVITNMGYYRSTDNGDTWTRLTYLDDLGAPVGALAVNSSSGHIFAGTWDGGVYRSTDNGDTWTQLDLDVEEVYAFTINSSGDIFAGTWDDGVYRSTDNGDTWIKLDLDCDKPTFAINSENHIFAGRDNGLFRSTDNGDTWTQLDLDVEEVSALAINSENHIFAAGEGGIFRSNDNGDSWTAINTGSTELYIFSLSINSEDRIFAGTVFSGVFRSVSTTSVQEKTDAMPASFYLEQNYPNPFNPSTTILYDLPKSTRVVLKVYDLLGQEVRTLVDEKKKPGFHTVYWDGKNKNVQDVASGIYLYRLEAESFTKTRKALLLR